MERPKHASSLPPGLTQAHRLSAADNNSSTTGSAIAPKHVAAYLSYASGHGAHRSSADVAEVEDSDREDDADDEDDDEECSSSAYDSDESSWSSSSSYDWASSTSPSSSFHSTAAGLTLFVAEPNLRVTYMSTGKLIPPKDPKRHKMGIPCAEDPREPTLRDAAAKRIDY